MKIFFDSRPWDSRGELMQKRYGFVRNILTSTPHVDETSLAVMLYGNLTPNNKAGRINGVRHILKKVKMEML